MITLDEALHLARAYKLSLPDVKALQEMATDFAHAKHIVIALAGSDAERADEAFTINREQRDAEQTVENKAFKAYQDAHPKPTKPKRQPVEPEYRDGMTGGERQKAFEAAHEANVRGEAEDRAAEVKGKSEAWYAWTAAGKPEK